MTKYIGTAEMSTEILDQHKLDGRITFIASLLVQRGYSISSLKRLEFDTLEEATSQTKVWAKRFDLEAEVLDEEFCNCNQDCLKKQCLITYEMIKYCQCVSCFLRRKDVAESAGKITISRG